MNGGVVLVEKDQSFDLRTLGHLLKDRIVQDVFGEDMALYFQVVFSDKRGWNLRNRVAHGMMDPDEFNRQNAERVLHAFLCLGFVRQTNKEMSH
jgi:hypothetical protein